MGYVGRSAERKGFAPRVLKRWKKTHCARVAAAKASWACLTKRKANSIKKKKFVPPSDPPATPLGFLSPPDYRALLEGRG